MESDKFRVNASEEHIEAFQKLKNDIKELEQKFLATQSKRQFLNEISGTTSLKSLEELFAQVEGGASREIMLKRKHDFESVCKERDEALKKIEDSLNQIDVARKRIQEEEEEAKKLDDSSKEIREKWKQLQKLNTQKRTALEMTFNVQIANEQSCADLLQQQAIALQEDNEKERLLEDKLLDLTAQVKQSQAALDKLRQETSQQAGDEKTIERARKHNHMLDMIHWYEEMQSFMENLSGFRLLRVEDSVFEVGVGEYNLIMNMDLESLKLTSVQISPATLDIDDLMEIALEENDVTFLLRETRMRVANMAQLQEHLELLSQEGVTCSRKGSNVELTFGAPDEQVHVEVEISSEYAQDHEWLQVHSIRPPNDRIIDSLNTTIQCRNLVDLIQQIVHELLQ